MHRRRLLLALVLVVLLAGCAGFSGSGGSNGSDGAAADAGSASTGAGSLEGPHPHTDGDLLDPRALTSEHLETIRDEAAFVVTDTTTVQSVEDDSVQVRAITEKHVDLDAERLLVEQRRENQDGTTELGQALYQNATTTCSRFSGSTDCREDGFDSDRAVARAVEVTSLETVAAPAFSPDGTTTVDGQAVYRFSADTLREDPPEQALSELGRNPTLEAATLFVSPEGYVVRYDVTATVDDDSGRVTVERSYRVELVEIGSLSPPEWVQT
jgi:hypothetical protein